MPDPNFEATLTATQVQELLLHRLGLRVGPEVAAYVLKRCRTALNAAGGSDAAPTIPVIGGDARTGVPLRRDIVPSQLFSPLTTGH